MFTVDTIDCTNNRKGLHSGYKSSTVFFFSALFSKFKSSDMKKLARFLFSL